MKRASLILALLGSVGSVAVACGGATSTDVFGTPTDSSGTSGGTSGTSGTATSGGTSGTATSGGTSGTATSGGTSGTATSGGTSGSTVDAGPPKPCVSSDGCAATEFCKRATCTAASGVCATRPTETATEAPVCGCDNVTYWNETVAAHDGVNVQAGSAECPKTSAAKCDGNNLQCANNRSCSLALPSSQQCSVNVGTVGTCWALPTSCAGVAAKASVCGSGKCVSRCEAIRNEDHYFTNNNCP